MALGFILLTQLMANINAIHNNKIKPTDFFGCFSPFRSQGVGFLMYAGLQTATMVKKTPGWMQERRQACPRRRLQPHNSQPNQGH